MVKQCALILGSTVYSLDWSLRVAVFNSVLTGLVLAGVSFFDAVVEPHMSDCHAVLCQRASLV